MSNPHSLIEKIKALPAKYIDEVEDFVDFIASRALDRSVTRAATHSSEASFAKIWNNSDDDAYDAF